MMAGKANDWLWLAVMWMLVVGFLAAFLIDAGRTDIGTFIGAYGLMSVSILTVMLLIATGKASDKHLNTHPT